MSSNDKPHIEAQTSPDPATTAWVPIWNMSDGLAVPSPVVNGQWLRGSGGIPVWSPIKYFDSNYNTVTGVATTAIPGANFDMPWPGSTALMSYIAIGSVVAGSSIRSLGVPSGGAGSRVLISNWSNGPFTILPNAGGSGVPFWWSTAPANLTLQGNDMVEFVYDGGAGWNLAAFIPRGMYPLTMPWQPNVMMQFGGPATIPVVAQTNGATAVNINLTWPWTNNHFMTFMTTIWPQASWGISLAGILTNGLGGFSVNFNSPVAQNLTLAWVSLGN